LFFFFAPQNLSTAAAVVWPTTAECKTAVAISAPKRWFFRYCGSAMAETWAREREGEKMQQILLSLLRRDLLLDNLSSTVLIHPHVAYPSMSFQTSSIINKCVLIHPGIMPPSIMTHHASHTSIHA
jgi:hypothetical protein